MSYEDSPGRRRAQRVLAAVAELHKRGYQLLRVSPGLSPSGTHWRCTLAPATLFPPDDGARLRAVDPGDARVLLYSTGQDNAYFGWDNLAARRVSARELADEIEARCPQLLAAAAGRDWAYAGWFAEMLGVAERGGFPSAYDDDPGDWPEGQLQVLSFDRDGAPGWLPAPPPPPPSPPPRPAAGR
ncbi:MAG: hypothetical protein JWO98_3371 [Frankiales bacterium]|nr:hypothetical protein [Frankiales bacterium]